MFELDSELLDGENYIDYEWWDETSMFDDHPTKRWVYGVDCYERRYCCRIPKEIADNEEAIFDWVYQNLGRVKWLE